MKDPLVTVAYVDLALALHGVPVEGAQRERVQRAFALTVDLAQGLLQWEAPPDCDPAPVFEP